MAIINPINGLKLNIIDIPTEKTELIDSKNIQKDIKLSVFFKTLLLHIHYY